MTCGKNEYLESSSSGSRACKSCDGSCSTCVSTGASGCLTCQPGKVLRQGRCVDALCTGGNTVGIVNSFGGMCLSSLVAVDPTLPINPSVSSVGKGTPPSPGATSPASTPASWGPRKTGGFAWWQTLLLSMGMMAVVGLCLVLWRQRVRKIRQNETMVFKQQKLDKTSRWLGWFGFGSASRLHTVNPAGRYGESESWRYEMDRMESGSTGVPASVIRSPAANQHFGSGVRSRRAPSIVSALSSGSSFPSPSPSSPREKQPRPISNTWTEPSVYSQHTEKRGGKFAPMTKRSSTPPPVPEYNLTESSGHLSQVPRPRQPIKDTSTARYSNTIAGHNAALIDLELESTGVSNNPSSQGTVAGVQYFNPPNAQPLVDVPLMPLNSTGQTNSDSHWMALVNRMPSSSNRNPFRRQY